MGSNNIITINESEKFSFYPNSDKQKSSDYIYRADLANKIRGNTWKNSVEGYKHTNKKSAKINKENALPLYLPSIFSEQARGSSIDQEYFEHTCFISVSFEQLESNESNLFDRLHKDPYVGLLYHLSLIHI